MNHKEHFRDLSGVAAEDSPYVHGGYATKSNNIGQHDGVTRRGRLRIACHPVQNGNPETGAGEDPEKGDQRRRRFRRNGPDTKVPRGDKPRGSEFYVPLRRERPSAASVG